MRPITKIIVHQTGYPNDTPESVTRWHTTPKPNGLGWSRVGYHFLITPDAKLHKLLPQATPGYHVSGENADSLGVCMVGRGDAFPLDRGYMRMAMFIALLGLLRLLQTAYPSIGRNVSGHREWPSGKAQGKTCPGFDAEVIRRIL